MNFKKIGKKFRNFRRDMRAISPVIATLLMIAIAVVASLVTYAWVMGYMGFTTGKTGKAIQIQSVAATTTGFNVYVQNVGDSAVKFSSTQSVYVNGTLVSTLGQVTYTGGKPDSSGTLQASDTGTLNVINGWVPAHADMALIKLTTVDGTQTQFTWYVP